MTAFAQSYSHYLAAVAEQGHSFGFDVEKVRELEPILSKLYKIWWRVNFTGMEYLPKTGPALIVGNSGSVLPWSGLMLLYALMKSESNARRLNILCDLDWVEDERLYMLLSEMGFVPWSSANAKQLFAQGELVAVFPEGLAGMTKPFSERYRLRPFDWTKLLPAVEAQVPIFPMACLGCDEAVPVLGNLGQLARFLDLPAYPVTPFFPWLPFPASLLMSFPVKWTMRILRPSHHQAGGDLSIMKQIAQDESRFLEGQIQAELNRLLRGRIKTGK